MSPQGTTWLRHKRLCSKRRVLRRERRHAFAQLRRFRPFVVIDMDIVAERFDALRSALPIADVFYAVKANPAPEILGRLAALGCSFDVASPGEIAMALAAAEVTRESGYHTDDTGAAIIPAWLGLENGWRPVSISNKTIPSEYKSARPSTSDRKSVV